MSPYDYILPCIFLLLFIPLSHVILILLNIFRRVHTGQRLKHYLYQAQNGIEMVEEEFFQ